MFHNQEAQNPAHLLQKSTLKTPTLPTYWPLGRLAEIARSLTDRHPRDGEGVEHSTLSKFRDQYARARSVHETPGRHRSFPAIDALVVPTMSCNRASSLLGVFALWGRD